LEEKNNGEELILLVLSLGKICILLGFAEQQKRILQNNPTQKGTGRVFVKISAKIRGF
jgi:hypothetical protein